MENPNDTVKVETYENDSAELYVLRAQECPDSAEINAYLRERMVDFL
jgi:hypothetical protein